MDMNVLDPLKLTSQQKVAGLSDRYFSRISARLFSQIYLFGTVEGYF